MSLVIDPKSKPSRPIDAILASYGVTIIPTSRRRGTGETHAGAVLKRILTQHGKEHLCLTLGLIRGRARNREALHSETIGALSDALAQRPDWHAQYEELVETIEAIDLDAMRNDCTSLRPWPVRGTMRAMVYRALENRMDAVAPVSSPGLERRAADAVPANDPDNQDFSWAERQPDRRRLVSTTR